MKGNSTKMSQVFKGHVIFLLCIFLTIQIKAQEFTNFSNLTNLSKLLIAENQTDLPESTIQNNCPQLYAHKEEPEKVKKSDDRLIPALPKSCPDEFPSNLLCFAALQSSVQLCNMSFTIKSHDKDQQLPEPTFYSNATSESICQFFENPTFVSNLTSYINKYVPTNIPESVFLPQGCHQLCKGNNTNLCFLILFNFKTMIKWKQVPNQEELQFSMITTVVQAQPTTLVPATTQLQLSNMNKEVNSTQTMSTVHAKAAPTSSTIAHVTTTITRVAQKVKTKHTGGTKQPKAKTEHSKKIQNYLPTEKTYESEQEIPQANAEDTVMENKYPADDDDISSGMENAEEQAVARPTIQGKSHILDSDRSFENPEDTHFIFYFISFVTASVCGYVAYIKRKRIIALIIEGRGRPSSSKRRSSSSRERSGGYRKLVNNLEEVITSSQSVKHSNVIY